MHSAGKHEPGRPLRPRAARLPGRRRLRRPVHRQHHGLRLRGDRPGPAALGGAAGALREPRPVRRRLRRGGGAADRDEHPPARHLHPQGVRERRAWWWRRPAARPTAACTCRPWRTSAASSSPCATWPRSSARTPYLADLKPGGRYVAKDMGEAGGVPMLLKTLLEGGFIHGDCMTVTGKTIAENLDGRELARRPGGDPPGLQPALAHRRRGRPVGLARAGRRHRQGGRHDLAPRPPRPGAGVRRRGGLLRRGRGRRLQGRRRAGDPLRGPQGRPRHARDAVDHRGALRPGPRRQGGPDHRRPLLRRARAASASATSAPRPRTAARSRWSRTATSSPSTPTPGRSSWRSTRSSWRTASATGAARDRLRLRRALEVRARGRPGATSAR